MPVELDGRMASALQVQMGREILAALTYKQRAYDFALQGWLGFEKWALGQEKEELQHSCDFGYYLVERGVRPYYSTIQLPPLLLEPPTVVFEGALALERLYWQYIEELYSMSVDLDDPDTCRLLKKKVEQQHESVAQLTTIVQKLKRADSMAALQDIDNHILEIK